MFEKIIEKFGMFVGVLGLIAIFAILIPVKSFATPYNACFDDVGLLSPAAQSQIRNIGQKLFDSGKVQFVVKIVSDANSTLEDGREFFNKTGIGDKEKNNGLLLYVIAKNWKANKPNKIRILTGYGMEGMFPDSVCGRILDEGLEQKGSDEKILKMVGLINESFLKLGDNPVPVNEKKIPTLLKVFLALIIIFLIFVILGFLFDNDYCGFSGGGGGYSGGSFGGGFGGGGFGGGSCGGGGCGR